MNKVVVTGMGCVSGLGADRSSSWKRLLEGRGAIGPLRKPVAAPDTELVFEGVGAPVHPDSYPALAAAFDEKAMAAVDPFSNFAALATQEALKDSGLYKDPALERAAIIYGSASGGNTSLEAGYQRMFLSRLPSIHPMTIPRYMNSASVSHLSMMFGVRGHCISVSSACATSAHAIAEAMYFIRSGRGPVVITGGSDASLTFGSLQGWKALQAMAPDTCRSFSIDRKGMVIGEGAATLILEDEAHAKKRGARIYAEVAGAGSTADARHITQPDAENASRAIRQAHADAGISDEQPILYSAHGTGTRLNDRTETQALKLAYPATLDRHLVISTKSAHGHTLGAAGALEFLFALESLVQGVAPPILNYLGPDPECALPLVLEAQEMTCKVTVSASFAFGGLNSVLIAKTY